MSGEITALPGEVWRVVETEDGDKIVIAVAPVGGILTPRFWYPSPPGRWMGPGHAFGERILVAWALHQRAVGAAERALRKAVTDLWNATYERNDWKKAEAANRVRRAESDLLALGVEP